MNLQKTLIIFIFICSCIYFLYLGYIKDIQNYLNSQTKIISLEVQTINNEHKELANIIFYSHINIPDIIFHK